MKNTNTIFAIVTVLLLANFSNIYSQTEISLGADLVSRYIWRGADFGNSPSIQPALAISNSGFEIGTWGAYQLGRDANSKPADEIDFYIGYSVGIGETTLNLLATDYYYPNSGKKFGNFKNDGLGSHIIETGASLSGPESFPLYFSASVNVYNEVDNSAYFEIGYSTSIQNTSLSFFAGATTGDANLYYGTKKFNFINLGVTAVKDIKITDDFSFPIFGSFIFNPNKEIAYFVFGISL
ncbi:MAG: hypothetical protein COW71_14820 [Ignavibacteriales bacterium CG18_big_fil_WC_8_21_14_2_50_31_20]|nr:MAG: hypothetical protein COW71_14820 [Ignavibacteriales bacterium CG18_big_fil_WC_8_21_14_2_50_31_20]